MSGSVAAEFDEGTHTWQVGDRSARILIATDGTLPAGAAAQPDGLIPYLGVAVAGVPNYFLLSGPDTAAQKSYIAKCLDHLDRTGASRIEVRLASQRIFSQRRRAGEHRGGRYWRAVGAKIPSAFEVQRTCPDDLPDDLDDAVYDGAATVSVDGHEVRARVRLTGQLDPIDGLFHWRGTLFAEFDVRLPADVDIAADGEPVRARLTERTPQGGITVVGSGAPPFALASTDVDVPIL
ncbi:MAG: DUF4873 domain-containing protein [Mycobacterium kyogaense]|uniref:DUF4873 domain-containing protein n=1 Tax=Mycobacterium kyogaense TaxID=2212479 RepID=UPI002FFD2EB5